MPLETRAGVACVEGRSITPSLENLDAPLDAARQQELHILDHEQIGVDGSESRTGGPEIFAGTEEGRLPNAKKFDEEPGKMRLAGAGGTVDVGRVNVIAVRQPLHGKEGAPVLRERHKPVHPTGGFHDGTASGRHGENDFFIVEVSRSRG